MRVLGKKDTQRVAEEGRDIMSTKLPLEGEVRGGGQRFAVVSPPPPSVVVERGR